MTTNTLEKLAAVREALEYITPQRRHWKFDDATIPKKYDSQHLALQFLTEEEQKQIVFRAPHSIYTYLKAVEAIAVLDEVMKAINHIKADDCI